MITSTWIRFSVVVIGFVNGFSVDICSGLTSGFWVIFTTGGSVLVDIGVVDEDEVLDEVVYLVVVGVLVGVWVVVWWVVDSVWWFDGVWCTDGFVCCVVWVCWVGNCVCKVGDWFWIIWAWGVVGDLGVVVVSGVFVVVEVVVVVVVEDEVLLLLLCGFTVISE